MISDYFQSILGDFLGDNYGLLIIVLIFIIFIISILRRR